MMLQENSGVNYHSAVAFCLIYNFISSWYDKKKAVESDGYH